ncbi:cobalamin biosynthesis protein [soil metagenome]
MNGPSRHAGAVTLGLLMDRAVGEPPAVLHPVRWFGSAMGSVERLTWADDRTHGVGYLLLGVGLGAAAGREVRSTAVAVWLVVAGRGLRRVARRIGDAAAGGDLDGARAGLPSLVGRDPRELDEAGIAAAVIESVAENSVDAVIAPVFWAVVGGTPGAYMYRAINTMDAMVGHRSERHRDFGWAAARTDDLANYVPARLFALLVAMVRPRRARAVASLIRRDAGAHPSPNAGVAETAIAAALERRVGGPLRYGERVELRPVLGDGPRPTAADIPDALAISHRVELLVTAVLAVSGLLHIVRSDR